jgi:putative sugar O-methyltransferase
MTEFIGSKSNRSVSDDGSYITAVKEAVSNYNSFCNFKRDSRYTAILEHASINQGSDCLEIIRSDSPALIERINDFKENDLEGGATVSMYDDIGSISPSTLRYLKVASDLKTLFGEVIEGNIAEVGVGYGGQLLISDKIFKFKEYHLFDLPPVLELTSRYLECHILNNSYRLFTLNQHNGEINYDLVVSNYAFSELPSKLQIRYIKKIFSKSKRGYLTMNSGLPSSAFQQDKLTFAELEKLLPHFEVMAERPLTHPGNYIIFWGKGY